MDETREALGGCLIATIITAVVVVVVGVITFVGWQAGWWFTNQNIQRTNHAIQSGYANQTGLLADFGNKYTQVLALGTQISAASGPSRTALLDQRLGYANQACADAAQITIALGPSNRAWVKANCSGSAVSLDSSLRKGS